MNVARKAIESMYCDKCTIIEKTEETDEITHVSSFKDKIIHEDIPCRLSISNIAITSNDSASKVTQSTKLFISPEIEVKAGSKIIVTHKGVTVAYKRSGFPAIHTNHQEIMLDLLEEHA